MAKTKTKKPTVEVTEEQPVEVVRDIEQWPIHKVKPYKRNAKNHPPEQVERIARLIKKHGFDQPIAVDKKGVIIKGHGRWLAAQSIEMESVPVVVRADLTPAQVIEARLADNRVAEGYGWDFELLRDDLVVAAEMPDFDAELTGFNFEDIIKSAEQVGQAITDGASVEETRLSDDGQEEWENAAVKQITLYFDAAQYEQVVAKLDTLTEKYGVESYTDVVLKLLEKVK